jgi:hypothetical protein
MRGWEVGWEAGRLGRLGGWKAGRLGERGERTGRLGG